MIPTNPAGFHGSVGQNLHNRNLLIFPISKIGTQKENSGTQKFQVSLPSLTIHARFKPKPQLMESPRVETFAAGLLRQTRDLLQKEKAT